ncbi:Scr1 family TA system antitoxin-like transcriptional regulator [Streptomyces nigrescens]|uniref:Scr1 family TA system antitoxin-like transcriptional regulator n=1 Tax=Streptomyces nigrescens TaxID=1920 RepID=UPI00347CDEE2
MLPRQATRTPGEYGCTHGHRHPTTGSGRPCSRERSPGTGTPQPWKSSAPKPVIASFVFSEAAVLSNLGGRQVMRDQIFHLRSCAELNGVSIQILPLSREHHAGLAGPFVVLETSDHQHLAYTEAQRSSELISDPDEVSILAQKYGMLRMQALNAEETLGLLERLLGEQ